MWLTGQRWGQDSIWLYVNESNTSALLLYTSAGFRTVSIARRSDNGYRKAQLLTLPLPPLPREERMSIGEGPNSHTGALVFLIGLSCLLDRTSWST